MDNNKRVLEALKMQPLSEEEKASRHILGRLYGPIATTTESTRNGRLYNRTLWENALSDEVFQEKVARKSLFLELGHPADREETDMTKICACIPEVPKIVDNDLYAYVDILDTPNGKLLKTLCDYGFVPGISSRGSGDVMENNEVDPETFYLETWDIVQLPAVKKARLTVCEGLDTKNIKLRKALTESLDEANEEDKAVMKQTLENLKINLEEGIGKKSQHPEVAHIMAQLDKLTKDQGIDCTINETSAGVVEVSTGDKETVDKVVSAMKDAGVIEKYFKRNNEQNYEPFLQAPTSETACSYVFGLKKAQAVTEALTEGADKDNFIIVGSAEYDKALKDGVIEPVKECIEEAATLPGGTPVDTSKIPEIEEELVEAKEENTDEEIEEADEVTEEEAATADEVDTFEDGKDISEFTVGTFMKEFEQLSPESPVELELVKVDDEFRVSISAVDINDDTLFAKFGCTFDVKEVEDEANADKEEANEEAAEETPVEETEEADDNGADDEVIESLKAAIRENTELKKRLKTFEGKEADGDSVVKKLEEEVQKYKAAFERTSAIAANAKKLETEVNTLKENLEAQATKVKELQEALAKSNKLTEGVDASKAKIAKLVESLNTVRGNAAESEKKLQEQVELNRKTTAIAKKYKAKYLESVEKYIASKAKMLGVAASDIKSKLSESFTMEDIDKVCDKMLTESIGLNKLPFGNGRGRIAIRETGAAKPAPVKFSEGYEIDDSLLELAGLKEN